MVVQNYNVQTSSQHSYLSVKSTTMLATKDLDAPTATAKFAPGQAKKAEAEQDEAVLSSTNGKEKKENNGLSLGHFKQKYKEMQDESINYLGKMAGIKAARTGQNGMHGSKLPSNPQELKQHMMKIMFELIMGKSSSSYTRVMNGENGSFSVSGQSSSFNLSAGFIGSFGISERAEAPREGWKVEHFEYESEQVSYQAQGVINTADGRTINVDINMYMSRQFVSYTGIDIESTRQLYDPLVINYGGTAASLMGDRFSFDLTSDGNLESLASLAEGSGFLALDKNGDGVINNGSELFGPNSGCGFSELREYDLDKNGWIDEADDVFDKLLVWTKDKDGNEKVYTLKELGIGAIYLGDIATEFSFKDDNNSTLGVMRSTSFFLKEDGGAGTVSHIDLAV